MDGNSNLSHGGHKSVQTHFCHGLMEWTAQKADIPVSENCQMLHGLVDTVSIIDPETGDVRE